MLLFLLACTPPTKEYTSDELIGLLITPTDLILPVGSQVQLEAIGLTENRETVPLTDSVDWNIEHYAIATISEDLDSEGILDAHSEGTTRVYAQYQDIKSPYSTIIVTASTLERLTIHPNEADLVEGETVSISATGYFSNGSSGNFTQQARWVTGDGSIVKIPSPGELLGISPGETRIHAIYEDLQSESIPVTVQPFYENGKADLIIEEAEGFIYEGVAYFDVRIKNQGNASAVEFWVDAWGERLVAPDPFDIGDYYEKLPYLSPSHYANLSFSFPFSQNSGASWIQIDTSNSVEESRESNNSKQISIETIFNTASADLSIDYFETLLNDDGTRSYFIDVTNNGSETIPYLFVDLYPDQIYAPELGTDGEQYIAIEDLAPGETKWADFIYQGTCSGCMSWCMVDSLNFLEEIDEDNNIGGPLLIP